MPGNLRHWWLACMLAATVSLACAQELQQFRIEPGPLNLALGQFAKAAGIFISADGKLTVDKRSPGLNGSFAPAEALRQLLQGTGLQAYRADDGGWILLAAPAAVTHPEENTHIKNDATALPPITVTGKPDSAALATPIAGSRAAQGQQALPLSLSVLSREALDLLQINDLQQALQASSGVTTSNVDTSRYRVYSRGFQIDTLQFDGISSVLGYLTPPNLSMYERVEVLRGPDGVMAGIGNSGGTINLIRKKPGTDFAATAQVGIGTNHTHSAQVDLGGPLNTAGSLRGRLVASSDNEALRQDGTFRHDDQLYAILEADVAPGTLLRAGGSRQWFDSHSMQYGYPTYTDGSFLRVSPSIYYGADWNRESYRLDTAFMEFQRRLGDSQWQLQSSVNFLHSIRESTFAGMRGAVDPATNLSAYQTSMTNSEEQQYILDVKLSGPIHVLGRDHSITMGASAIDQEASTTSAPGNPRYFPASLTMPPSDLPLPSFNNNVTRQTTRTRQENLYGYGRFSLVDKLELVAGLRMTRWSSVIRADPFQNAAGVVNRDDGYGLKTTPAAALVLNQTEGRQFYAAISQIYTPQSQRDASGTLLAPLQGRQQELGLKQELANDKALLSTALFRIVQANRAMNVPGDTTGTVYAAQGKAKVQGLDTQLTGEPLPGLNVSLGYVRSLTRYLDGSADTGRYAFSAFTPSHLVKAWLDWRPGGNQYGWNVGGAIKVSSEYHVQDGSVVIRQPGLATIDLWTGTSLTAWLDLRAHVENVTNRLYYQSLSSTADHNFLGNQRKLTVTLRARY